MNQVSLHKSGNPPCNGCTICCKGDLILVLKERGDDVDSYDTFTLPNGMKALKHKENGDCIYLGEHGCTIHGRTPLVCRTFDCRVNFLRKDRAARRKLIQKGLVTKEIFEQGRKLLPTLPKHEQDYHRSLTK